LLRTADPLYYGIRDDITDTGERLDPMFLDQCNQALLAAFA
jgi:hypothetical protein